MFELSTNLTCVVSLHDGSSEVLGSNMGQDQPRSDTLTNRLPRPRWDSESHESFSKHDIDRVIIEISLVSGTDEPPFENLRNQSR
ncbi:hypothetical protein TNCV_4714971 [Trichonephila clavipes]|nr:hypothetical protein TNCV_4714971 [Trichonephila clavipes]